MKLNSRLPVAQVQQEDQYSYEGVVLDSACLFCYDSAIICKGYEGDTRAFISLAESLNGESRQGAERNRITPEPLAERPLPVR